MLDNIREWISDNLRYLLLGFGGVLALILIVSLVRMATGAGKRDVKEGGTEAAAEQPGTEGESEAADDGIELTQNDPDILEVMTKYYNARAEQDFDTIRSIDPAFSAEDEADLQGDVVFEKYDNIMVYSIEGLEKDSWLVFTYFDLKITGITTPAPTLVDEYLEKNDAGNLVIVNKNSTQEIADFVERVRASAAVQSMVSDVNRKLMQAAETDEDLEKYVEKLRSRNSGDSGGSDSGQEDGGDSSDAPAVNGTAKATTEVRVRSEASTNGVIYGMLTTGYEVTVLENLDNGWSKIQYSAGGTTIEGYVMTQYLEAE